MPRWLEKKPERLFYAVCLFLAVSWGLIYVIDVANTFDLREQWYGERDVSFFWFHWFRTPVERVIQVMVLAAAMYVFLAQALRLRRKIPAGADRRAARFSLWMGGGLGLMILEEYGNLRHVIRIYVERWAGEGKYGVMGTVSELLFFAALGAMMVYAFVRYRDVFWSRAKTARFMVLGYLFYGVAVGASWLGTAFRDRESVPVLYDTVGGWVAEPLFTRDEQTAKAFEDANAYLGGRGMETLDFWIINRVVEESIELLAAAALLVAAVAFWGDWGDCDSDG